MNHTALAVPFLLCLLPRVSAADTPAPPSGNSEELRPRAGSFSMAALAGYSYGAEFRAGGSQLAFGYGGRAGYSFEASRLYLGVTVLGHQNEVEYDDTSETGTELYVNVGIDIGAELVAAPFIIRPYLGVGAQLGIYDGPSGGNSAIFPHLTPGLLARYPLGPLDFGVDARMELGGGRALCALGSVGVAF